jgi:hypothetical protein
MFDAGPDPFKDIAAGAVVRFILGRDTKAQALSDAALAAAVADPFAILVLRRGHRPQTFVELLELINAAQGAEALPVECFYRVADGGQIPWTPETEAVDRHLRLVLTRGRGDDAELFVATAPPFDSRTIFLQVFAWDPQLGAYNFYERRAGIWSWAGRSWDALSPDTRGKGPFDSHVNGAPVMKELKLPWLHWHSMSAQIRAEMLHPEDPLRSDPIYNSPNLKGGEDLERVVKSGIARWTGARFAKSITNRALQQAPTFLRHVLETTTFNLACAPQQSRALLPDEMLRLPPTFFLDVDGLFEELGLPLQLGRPKVLAERYLAALRRYQMKLGEGTFQLDGDTYFAFAVPERSFEDRMVLRELLGHGAISRRLAASMLMVDFPNPVFSPRRAALLQYVPDEIALNSGTDLDGQFAARVAASAQAQVQGSAEAEFLEHWRSPGPEWETAMANRIDAYWKRIGERADTEPGFDAYFRLAESRRREIRRRRLQLLEFELTLATAADFPDGSLSMTEAGDVVPAAG